MAIKPFGSGSNSGGGDGGGGAAPTLGNITGGPLRTGKGGTGINATDLGDLRQKLGIANPSNPNDEYLDYCVDTRHQPNNTIQRVDVDTSNALSDVEDGLIIKVGNDQVMINLADGKEFARSHTTGTRSNWGTPVAVPDLVELTTGAQFKGLTDGSIGWTSTDSWLPQYPDNTRPTKVIVARVGEYLIACARYNMWWSSRPTTNTWANIPWRWEGDSQVPKGLEFSGGVNDEDRIPAGAVAVLGNKENVDQDSAGYILLMTKHDFNATDNGGTSTFTGYFVDDDNGKTIKRSTSTITKTTTHWSELKVGIDDIEDTIITADRDTGDPVFHGIIPEISSMGFPGYRFKTGTDGLVKGDISYVASTRTAYVWHKDEDTHLGDLFHEDFEVEIHKDDSNYIKGVFEQVQPNITLPGGVVITGALFRSEDLKTEGTISANDTVEIKGHKSVVTKTDRILPVNLGLAHGSSEANKLVAMNSSGNTFALTTTSSPLKAMLILKQTTNVSISGSTTQWTRLTTQTGAWQLANKSTDYIEFNGSGLAYCSAGSPDSINVQVQLLYRHATTEAGLSGSWTQVNLGTGDDAFFRSKLYAGNSNGNIGHRDYHWTSGSRIIPLSALSGASDGNYVHFTIQMRKEDLNFANINEFRNTFLSCKVWDGSIIHSN
ncbi:MAG: hypothetical protein ISN29_10755 [Gammaproteobacteria bacterium AqS3]|nr:hypothetical protein [Gammaproteobacteria bacterium AqS3]